MDWFYLLSVVMVIYFIVCVILIIIGDCDIILQITEKFGKKADVLHGKVVWITGASSGIGEYLSYELGKVGCRLILSARREEELRRVKRECLIRGNTKEEDIMVLPLDVLKFETHPAAFDAVCKTFSKVDILVNNAGRAQKGKWEKTMLSVDRKILEVNVLGVLSLTKVVLPSMLERREGHIVNMSSVDGKLGAPSFGSYSGSKHALQGWFDSLRTEVADQGIYVTSICPGPVLTNILSTALTENEGEMLEGSVKPGVEVMSTKRCAELCALSIANKLDETWLSKNPMLALFYLKQYFPNLFKYLSSMLGLKAVQ